MYLLSQYTNMDELWNIYNRPTDPWVQQKYAERRRERVATVLTVIDTAYKKKKIQNSYVISFQQQYMQQP